MPKSLLSPGSFNYPSKMPSGKQAFPFRLPSGTRPFLKLLVRQWGERWGKLSGKRSGRLPGLKSTIYPKCGFRLPSVYLPDRHYLVFGNQLGQKGDRKSKRKVLPGRLLETPQFASGYLPGCAVFASLQKLNFQTIK